MNDREFLNTIIDIQKRLQALEKAEQTLISDWVDLNIGAFSISTTIPNILISNATYNFTNYFNLGDKVRYMIIGDTAFRYGIVSNITSNQISITGNSLPVSSTLIAFSRSKQISPNGFPNAFQNNVTPYPDTTIGATTLTLYPCNNIFNSYGNLIYVSSSIDFKVNTSNTSTIYLPYPVQQGASNLNSLPVNIYDYSSLSYITGLVSSNVESLAFKKAGGGNFISGTEYLIQYTYFYTLM